jgi:hypothetical protein
MLSSTTDSDDDVNRPTPTPPKQRIPVSPLAYFGFRYKSPSTLIFFALSISLAIKSTIPASHVLFSILYSVYIGCINRFRFQRNALADNKNNKNQDGPLPLLHTGRGPWFKNYVMTFGVLGVLLPVAFMLLAPSAYAQAAAPHLYLVSCQLVMESLVNGSSQVHSLCRALVPIGFNTFRMWSLMEWTKASIQLLQQANHHAPLLLIDSFRLSISMMGWSVLGCLLSISNLVVWTYNLFIFLLLRMLPQYIDPVQFPSPTVEWKLQLFPVVREWSWVKERRDAENNSNNNNS